MLLQLWQYLKLFFTVHRCLIKILYRRERPSKKLLSSTKSTLTFSRLLIYRQLGTWEPAFAALATLETPLSDNFSCIPSAAIQQHKHLSIIHKVGAHAGMHACMKHKHTRTSSWVIVLNPNLFVQIDSTSSAAGSTRFFTLRNPSSFSIQVNNVWK